jgi:hypothetical protein
MWSRKGIVVSILPLPRPVEFQEDPDVRLRRLPLDLGFLAIPSPFYALERDRILNCEV